MKNTELAEFEAKVKEIVALQLRSNQATIERLYPQIEQFLSLGYSHERTNEILTKAGCVMTLGSFRSAIARVKASKAKAT